MNNVFPISAQEIIFPEVEFQSKNQKNTKKSKLNIKKLNKFMVKVVARKATYSKMLRRSHLYDLKKTTSKVVEGECYLIVECLDKGQILCGNGSVCCNHCFIPVHDKCVRHSGWEKMKFVLT